MQKGSSEEEGACRRVLLFPLDNKSCNGIENDQKREEIGDPCNIVPMHCVKGKLIIFVQCAL